MYADATTLAQVQNRLSAIGERWGVALPEALVEFFACPRMSPDLDPDDAAEGEYFAYFCPPDLDAFIKQGDLYAAYPLRCLALLQCGDGDALALYVPRGGAPALIYHDHEQSSMNWCTDDVVAGLIDPDRYSGLSERPSPMPPPGPHRLLVDVQGDAIATALAKPWALNAGLLHPHPSALAEREVLIARLHREPGSGATQILQRHLQRPDDLLRRSAWRAIAADRLAHGEPQAALMALENALALGFTYPGYGADDAEAESALPSWQQTVSDLEAMQPVIDSHGDRFDRWSLARLLASAREFARNG